MADEVIRIEFGTSGGGSGGGPGGGGGGSGGPGGGARGRHTSGGGDYADAWDHADRKLKREAFGAEVREAYNTQKFGTPYDPNQLAKQREKETHQRNQAVLKDAQQAAMQRAAVNQHGARQFNSVVGTGGQIGNTMASTGIAGVSQAGQVVSAGASGAMGGATLGMMLGGPAGAVVGALGGGAFGALKNIGSQAMNYGMNTFNGIEQAAGRYSPQVAMANAMGRVNTIQGDVRRSQFLGEELGGLATARNKLQETGKDLVAEIIKPMIPLMTQFLNQVTDWLTEFKPQIFEFMNGGIDFFNFTMDAMRVMIQILNKFGTDIHMNLPHLRHIRANTEKKPTAFIDQFMDQKPINFNNVGAEQQGQGWEGVPGNGFNMG